MWPVRGLGVAAGSVFCCAESGISALGGASLSGAGSQSSTHFPGPHPHFTTAVISSRSWAMEQLCEDNREQGPEARASLFFETIFSV